MAAIPNSNFGRFKFTVEDYYRMAETGILGPEDRVELINGEIIRMSPIGRVHGSIISLLTRHFMKLDPAAVVWVQSQIHIDDHNHPQPDITLLSPRDDLYRGKTPTWEDVLLIVEVSDTTFRYDYDVKRPLYARGHIPELWIIDVPKKNVHLCKGPSLGEYRIEKVLQGKQKLAPFTFPKHVITVAKIVD
ncbi:MAG: Uma2 family endonuclease [Phycisphaeraceae bacterium]